jgi:UDP-N-acetylglucosamine:LPS N-acetylglucosamine transferase
MKKIQFVFFDAGGGHRSAATALQQLAMEQNRPWHPTLMNLQDVLDAMDIFRQITGRRFQELYNSMLAAGWTLGSKYVLPPMQGMIRLYHARQVKMLAEHWRTDTPDLLVSVVPNFNRALFEGIRAADPQVPFVTILTDFADYPPHFWMEKQDQHVICGTDRAYEQARAVGYRPERLHLVSGMILRPSFYVLPNVDRARKRMELGLEPDVRTGIVLFGGQGSPKMLEIVRQLQSADYPLQLILMCGRNKNLATELRAVKSKLRLHVVEFTSDVPLYMHLSDFFIGKPGPGSISEALAMNLPVIIERNAWTLPQELYNASWVLEKQVGVVVPNFKQVRPAIESMLAPESFSHLQQQAAAIHNRAVYEILEILDTIEKQ